MKFMRYLGLVIWSVLIGSNILAQSYGIPYRKGDLWGLVDTSFNMLVQPEYDSMGITSTTGILSSNSGFSKYDKVNYINIIKSNNKLGLLFNHKLSINPKYYSLKKQHNLILAKKDSLNQAYTCITFSSIEFGADSVQDVFKQLSFNEWRVVPKWIEVYELLMVNGNRRLITLNLNSNKFKWVQNKESSNFWLETGENKPILHIKQIDGSQRNYKVEYDYTGDSLELKNTFYSYMQFKDGFGYQGLKSLSSSRDFKTVANQSWIIKQKRRGKYGVRDTIGKMIIPYEYDSIIIVNLPNSELAVGFKLYKDNRFQYSRLNGSYWDSSYYTDLILRDYGYTFKIGDKWGFRSYISYAKIQKIEARYTYPIFSYSFYDIGIAFYSQVNEVGKLMGYCDLMGREYFKD